MAEADIWPVIRAVEEAREAVHQLAESAAKSKVNKQRCSEVADAARQALNSLDAAVRQRAADAIALMTAAARLAGAARRSCASVQEHGNPGAIGRLFHSLNPLWTSNLESTHTQSLPQRVCFMRGAGCDTSAVQLMVVLPKQVTAAALYEPALDLVTGHRGGTVLLLMWDLPAGRLQLICAIGETGPPIISVNVFPDLGAMIEVLSNGHFRVGPPPSSSLAPPINPLGGVPVWRLRQAAVKAHRGRITASSLLGHSIATGSKAGGVKLQVAMDAAQAARKTYASALEGELAHALGCGGKAPPAPTEEEQQRERSANLPVHQPHQHYGPQPSYDAAPQTMTYPPPAAGGPSTSNDGYGGGGGMSYGHMGSMPHMGSMQHMGSMASMGSMGHVNPLQPPVQNMGSMQHMGSMQRGSMHSGSGAGSEMHVPGPGMGSGPYGRRMSMVASEYDNLSRRTSTSGHVDMGGPMSGEADGMVPPPPVLPPPAPDPNAMPAQHQAVNPLLQNCFIRPDDLRLIDCVGAGAEGTVWRGRWHHIDVAVKEMHTDSASYDKLAYKTLMKDCWAADPAARPAFHKIAERLMALIRWQRTLSQVCRGRRGSRKCTAFCF
eukprot:XP_001694712.1 predicted protein [Chlamydomonas reinhardtii]